MRKTVAQIKPGDTLLCYIAGISRWIGSLEVVGGHFVDDRTIWSGGDYPERLKVRRLVELTFETAVPVVDTKADMKMFATLANPNQWSIRFRASPSSITDEDAAVVLAALADAERNPIERPVPPAKLANRSTPGISDASDASDDEQVESEAEDTEQVEAEQVDVEPGQRATSEGSEHTEMQWLLLRLGADMGLSVWAPKNDRGREWNGHSPGEVAAILDELPLQFDAETMRRITNIDVLWLRGHSVMAAFEIEHSTSVYSGLLRMSDLLALQPNLAIPLYIVAPDERRMRVFREVNRPTFERRERPLREVCQFIAFSAVREGYGQVRKYAKFMKPEVIEQWAEVCELT